MEGHFKVSSSRCCWCSYIGAKFGAEGADLGRKSNEGNCSISWAYSAPSMQLKARIGVLWGVVCGAWLYRECIIIRAPLTPGILPSI